MTIFLIFLLFTAWFTFARKRSSKLQYKNSENFWNRESKANTIRKSSLECLDYITIPLTLLSINVTGNPKFEECQNQLELLSDKKIVNLTGLSNTDLKLEYGSANLRKLTEYDLNFTTLVRTLQNYGKILYDEGYISESIMVLEFAVSCKTDISATYFLLKKLYQQTNQSSKIVNLKNTAQQLNSLMKNSIIAGLS